MAMTIPENLSREQYCYLARRAELRNRYWEMSNRNGEMRNRYEDMAQSMQKLVLLVTPAGELTVLERNLLSTAYKKAIGSILGVCGSVSSILQKREDEGRIKEEEALKMKECRSSLERKVSQLHSTINGLIDSHLIPSARSADSHIFYLKMKAGLLRDLVEFNVGDEKTTTEEAVDSFQQAQVIAAANLSPADPLRLELALDFATFYGEIINQRDRACSIAEQAYLEAKEELKLDTLGEKSMEDDDNIMMMHLLKDFHTIWTSSV